MSFVTDAGQRPRHARAVCPRSTNNMGYVVRMVSIFASLLLLIHATTAKVYLNQWAVYIDGGKLVADRVAQTNGYTNLGQIGSLENYYLFEHRRLVKRSTSQARHHHTKLRREPEVLWVEQQVLRKRVKRDLIEPSPKTSGDNWRPQWTDPGWKKMWYLNKGAHGHYDMNVVEAWKQGYTGKGVVVTILDDGIERTHTDLMPNYDPEASEDINSGDHDPMPRYDSTDENRHGTRCAGEVAAIANNTKCGVGVAYRASIGGVRMLDGDVSDVVEARALSLNPQHVDIYSASWGPDDNGQVVDGPARLAKAAFVKGVLEGRGGKGSIFVWASGNGGSQSDSCSCDGYTNSVFTLSVSSTSEHGNKPWYLEECSSTLTTTYSSGESYRERKIVTTDLHDRCTESHTGTSASAPIAAGLCALALEANPELTWRDMQYIVLLTSRTTPLVDGEWVTNGVGRKVSHRYGYGVMDAGAMVDLASRWFTVPDQHVCAISAIDTESAITGKGATFRVTVNGCEGSSNEIKYLEHVQAKISLHYSRRGDLQIFLVSPSGTRSTLLSPRKNDYEGQKLRDWPFMSVFYWGENPNGEWKLIIENTGSSLNFGMLQSWELVLYGTDVNPVKVRRRQPDVHNTTHGEACHHECNELEGCVGALASQCVKCKHYQLDKQGECVASCPDGTYQDDVSATCMSCASPCHTCKGSSVIEDCLSCDKDFFLVQELGSCVTQCPRGYYAHTQGLCLPCDDGCGVCVEAPDQCVTCNHGYLFENERCVVHCDDRSFRNELSSCELCDPSCRTCVGPTNRECILCAVDMFYENGSCVPFCSSGHYEAETTDGRLCERCHVTCRECSGPLSDQCSQCPEPYKLKEGSCHESCGQHMYVDEHDVCRHCNADCLSCHGPSANDCLSCHPLKVLDGSHCVDKCREGFYESIDNSDIDDIVRQCHQCHANCQSCHGRLSTECRSCRPGLSLDGTECVLGCSDGKYDDSGKCCQCPANCLRCVGPADNQCIACRRGSFLFNGRCLKGTCPDGYYANKKQCLRCHMSCAACTGPGADSCQLCHAGYTFSNKLCVRIVTTDDFDNSFCGHQEYLDNIFGSCQPCHHSCGACRGPSPDECLSCVVPYQLDHRHGDCVLCCSSSVTEHCCVCHPVSGKCATDDDPLKDYPNHLASTSPTYAVSRATSSSAWLGLVVVVCLFSLTAFCLIFGLLQAHSHELLCWKQQRTLYQPVPMFYHRQGAVGVRLGKQMNTSAADSETSDEHLYQNSPTHREVA